MANGTAVGYDPEARQAALEERVGNLATRFTNLETSIANLASEIRGKGQPQWGVIGTFAGVFLALVVAGGGLISSSLGTLKADTTLGFDRANQDRTTIVKSISDLIQVLPDKYLTRTEVDKLSDRAAEERKRVNDTLALSLPRAEWLLRNTAVDAAIGDVSRRIDEVRNDFGSTYTLRDALADLKTRMVRLENLDKVP